MKLSQSVAGLDVSKGAVDLCVLAPETEHNARIEDLGELVERLRHHRVELVVLEPSGGYERPVIAALQAAEIPCALVNARRIRDFARASGRLAKTDRLDARVIADYARRMAPAVRPKPSAAQQLLTELLRRRRQLVEFRKAEMTRLQQVTRAELHREIASLIRILARRITSLEARMAKLIKADPELANTNRVLRSMPGIGAISAAALLAELPELGKISRRAIAALVGLAPYNRDSGRMRGRRTIWGGRASLRKTLYMAALAAVRSDPSMKSRYKRLKDAGKNHKTAITAVLRSIIVTLNAMVRDKKTFSTA